MKALVFHRPKHVSYDTVPDPRIEQPTDAIVKVTATCICGSDLHIYNGLFPQLKRLVMGHEFMGTVEEVGSAVSELSKGDRVLVPFPIACGQCYFCSKQLFPQCERSNPENYGPEGGLLTQKGGGLFGYTNLYGGYAGGQAELVRVPFADVGPRKVPESLTDDQAVLMTDILPTGWTAIDWAGLRGGETVAVFGCGPVGLMAQKAAWLKGAGRVIGIDREDYRLERARSVAKSELLSTQRDDIVQRLRDMTDGRGPDVVVDAVGMEAHRSRLDKLAGILHGEVGTTDVLETCLSAVRRGGVVSVVGVYGSNYRVPLGQIFDKGISMRFGQAPVQKYIDELITLMVEGKLRTDDVVSHRLPLSQAPHAYELFNEKKDGCVKVILKP